MKLLNKGCLISIEGIDGSGKTTLTKKLYEYFSQKYPTILTKEPSETLVGKKIRSFVQENNKIAKKAEYLLFASDRAQHFDEIIIPNLKTNKIIISDRSGYSSLAYQGYGCGISIDMIKKINSWIMGDIEPDYIIYLKIEPSLGLQRVNQRNEGISKFENLDFLAKVSEGFDSIFKNKKNVKILDGSQSTEEILRSVINFMEPKLNEN